MRLLSACFGFGCVAKDQPGAADPSPQEPSLPAAAHDSPVVEHSPPPTASDGDQTGQPIDTERCPTPAQRATKLSSQDSSLKGGIASPPVDNKRQLANTAAGPLAPFQRWRPRPVVPRSSHLRTETCTSLPLAVIAAAQALVREV